MNALRNARHWLALNGLTLAAFGLLCLPTAWSILYLCGVVARGPM